MSYCRWSSDHFECDVYVYESVSGGWTTHVAGRRRKTPLPDSIKAMYPTDWKAADAVDRYMEASAADQAFTDSQPCDEHMVNYLQTDGTTRPRIRRSLKDSEYLDLSTIGPEAGESYSDDSPGQCADRLEALKAKGFNVPQYAIDALREEEAEMDSAANNGEAA